MVSGNRRLIWQLYPPQLLVALLALLAASWLIASSVRGFYLQQVEEDLAARVQLLQGEVRELLPEPFRVESGAGSESRFQRQVAALQAFCLEAGRAASTRITVVAPDGLVLADSEQTPAKMENHGARPEIVAALAGHQGRDTRFSNSVYYDTMYVAIPLFEGKEVMGVLRAAIPLTAVDQALGEIYRRIALIALLVAVLAALATWLFARRISHPLEEMRQGAERFASGRFDRKIGEEGAEELTALARAMNRMAGQLDQRLQTIAAQHNQLQTVFCSMLDGVITVGSDERVLEINQAAAILLGVRPDRIKDRNIRVAIPNSGLQALIREALTAYEHVEGEFTLLDERGRERFCRVHGVRLPELQDEESGAVVVISDITKLRRLESLRRDFVANVSHELKTPITSIEGFAETLLDGALEEPEEARRFTGIILQQSRRLHAIVEDLLTLSHIEQEGRRQAIPLQELPLAETIRAALLVCAQRAEARGMPLELKGPENLKAWLNPALLEQALINLIDNAVKYAPEGTQVTITTEEAGGEIRIMVSDRGPGIPPSAIPRLFERFYRVDKARSSRMGGTGLGLAIVKHIIQAHHGRVSVQSREGRGSTFTLHLPTALLTKT